VQRGARREQLTRVQRLRSRLGHRQFHLAQKADPRIHRRESDRRLRERNQRHQPRQQADRLHHLNEVNGLQDPADGLSPERQPAPQAHLSRHRFTPSDNPRHHLSRVSRTQAGLLQPQNPDRRVVSPRTLLSKAAVKVSELSVARPHHRPVPVRLSVGAELNEENRVIANLARLLAVRGPARRAGGKSAEDNRTPINLQPRRLPVQVRARCEAERSADNRALINLQPRHLPVQVRAKRETHQGEGRTSMVNLVASQRVEGKLHLRAVRDNRSVGRKRERGLQRRSHKIRCLPW
jgi:hypothetical protein